MQNEIKQRSVEDRGDSHVLAGGGGAGDGEDAAANDRADAEGDQAPGTERALEPLTFVVSFFDQVIDALGLEELSRHVNGSIAGMGGGGASAAWVRFERSSASPCMPP